MKRPTTPWPDRTARHDRNRERIVELVIRVDRLLDRGLTVSEACEFVGIDQPTLRCFELALGLHGPEEMEVDHGAKETQP